MYNRRKWYTGGKRSGNSSGNLRRNQAVSGDIRVRSEANGAATEDIEEYRQKVLVAMERQVLTVTMQPIIVVARTVFASP